jgi:hypothetical protein
MDTALTVLTILVGLPLAGTLLLVGGVLGGRAAMRGAIASGRVHPSCPHPDCPYRPGAVPGQTSTGEPFRAYRED